MWTAAVPWRLRLGPSVVSVAPQHLQLLCSRRKPSGRLLAEGTVHPPCRVTRPHTVWPEPIALVLTLSSSLLSLVCLSVSRASRQSFKAGRESEDRVRRRLYRRVARCVDSGRLVLVICATRGRPPDRGTAVPAWSEPPSAARDGHGHAGGATTRHACGSRPGRKTQRADNRVPPPARTAPRRGVVCGERIPARRDRERAYS